MVKHDYPQVPERIAMQEDSAGKDQQKNQERYADELAGPDDYWLTITDAARATRRQDVTIRRWISKGLLPVRRQHVGLNQRTRLVRASDLAALTPIIDPAGAISTERGKLDLTSIPMQQAQIKSSQQNILTQLEGLQHQLSELRITTQRALEQQQMEQEKSLASLRDEMTTGDLQLRAQFTEQCNKLDIIIKQLRDEWNSNIQALATQITTRLTDLTHNVRSIAEQQQLLTRSWEDNTKQQQEYLDILSANLQQEASHRAQIAQHITEMAVQIAEIQIKHELEVEVRERLASQVNQSSVQLTQLLDKHEHEESIRADLARQVEELTTRLLDQQATLESEVQLREQLMQQVSQLTAQHDEQKDLQQWLSTSLAQRQEQFTSFEHRLTEQARQLDLLLQHYVKLKEQQTDLE